MNEDIDDRQIDQQMLRMSRRSFVWGGVAVAGVLAGRQWLISREENNGMIYPLRRGLEFNEAISRKIFRRGQLAATFDTSEAADPRANGDDGLSAEFDASTWQLNIVGVHGKSSPVTIGMDEIRALPKVDMVTELKCIEGWSQVVHWTGARLIDLMEKYPPTTRTGKAPDVRKSPEELVEYVGMVTPDGGYYVGLDMESAIHEQTLLCYEMNGKPLTDEHGAPLRLAIPVKYGIKNIKRIGTITYASTKPADFWAERGYDWYAGH
ncbi:MAG: molybdopterin-dependent oxidoreductase [Chthonomonadales bacterium]